MTLSLRRLGLAVVSLIALLIVSCGDPASNSLGDDATSAPQTSPAATSTSAEPAATITATYPAADTIRVEVADGCPATVIGHHDGSSTAAGWVANPDASGLDIEFVPGEPIAALICRYTTVVDTTGVSGAGGGDLLSSTSLDADAAAEFATTINEIVPSAITSACLFGSQEARYTALVFVIPGRSDVDLWLKDWIGCPELSNGSRASGELINGVGSAFLAQLDGAAPPAPQRIVVDDESATLDTSTGSPPPDSILSPDLGEFSDVEGLVAALRAFGSLDNEEPAAVAAGVAPSRSICADILMNNEPSAGTVVFQGLATFQGITGVVFVLRNSSDSLEVRMYSVHDADPVTGGCPLLASRQL